LSALQSSSDNPNLQAAFRLISRWHRPRLARAYLSLEKAAVGKRLGRSDRLERQHQDKETMRPLTPNSDGSMRAAALADRRFKMATVRRPMPGPAEVRAVSQVTAE
jgi:hypothetical protein